jgi:serine protease AprX
VNAATGTGWHFTARRGMVASLITLSMLAVGLLPGSGEASEGRARISVIVRELPGAGDVPETTVEALGGRVGRRIGIIDGFVAVIPERGLAALRHAAGVHSVTRNRRIEMSHVPSGSDASMDTGSTHLIATAIGATRMYEGGFTGRGVDVALIDTGVVPVNGLTHPGKVVNGPDLSFESQVDALRHLDTYGHGTHMAGIIAGRDDGITSVSSTDHQNYLGIAPGSRIVNVKVGNALGVTDVSQVLAAIDWVVQHRNSEGMNIRVLNLSFGTDGIQDYRLDPLTYAVEVAWRRGIVVVAAAGNDGFGNDKLNNPAYDPFILAVGAQDMRGTVRNSDDVIPSWSSRGDGSRNPDIVAPGKSVLGLRNPGSFVDEMHPEGYVNERFFRGSGTSQSAAVVSGAVALLLQQRPDLTPDQVKRLVTSTANRLPAADPIAQGRGMINLAAASTAATPTAAESAQPFELASGTGSLEAARGSVHVADEDGVELNGEQDIFGTAWDGKTWSGLAWEGKTWSGGEWLGKTWSGDCWCATSWAGKTWSGKTWSGKTWSGKTWSGENWSGKTWSGKTWSGDTWAGKTWSGKTWSGKTWSDDTWSGKTWSGVEWS